jgi:hypothetical protein
MERDLTLEKLGETGGHCDCCGRRSRRVWGLLHRDDRTVAAYWMHWTVGHLDDPGANLDLVIGRWGDDATADDRFAVSLVHREQADGTSALMVIDAGGRLSSGEALASTALRRDEVIGTPLAAQVFAFTDAIYEQDGRFF